MEEEIFVCPDCGAEIKEGTGTCPNCGLELIWDEEEEEAEEEAEEETEEPEEVEEEEELEEEEVEEEPEELEEAEEPEEVEEEEELEEEPEELEEAEEPEEVEEEVEGKRIEKKGKEKEHIQELVGKIRSLEDMMEGVRIMEIRKIQKEEVDVEQKISRAEKMIKTVEKMIFWAEEFDINTEKMQDLLVKSKDELEVGDWDAAMKYARDSMNVVFKPMIQSLETEIRRASQDLKKAEVSGKDVSKIRPIVRKARSALDKEDLPKSIELMRKYKEYKSKIF